MLRNVVCGVICLTGVMVMAHAAIAEASSEPSHFVRTTEPGWVDPLPACFDAIAPDREKISDGVRYLLVDNQLCLGATNAAYNHYAFRFLTEAGVRDAATIQVKFDPTFETLQFHRLRLWRGTNVMDCLQTTTFKTAQREESLEWQLLDGRLTVVALPEDVRVGDILEYSYTIAGNNPVFEGRAEGNYLLGWSALVNRMRLRVLIPPGRSLHRRMMGSSAPKPIDREVNGCQEWLWDLTNSAPIQTESDLPVWYRPLPFVSFSEFDSWGDVARWAKGLYSVSNTSMTVALELQLDTWRNLPREEDQALAALQFTQDEIRYFGLEFGYGSHRPSPPPRSAARPARRPPTGAPARRGRRFRSGRCPIPPGRC